jgi:hypothetical protein
MLSVRFSQANAPLDALGAREQYEVLLPLLLERTKLQQLQQH